MDYHALPTIANRIVHIGGRDRSLSTTGSNDEQESGREKERQESSQQESEREERSQTPEEGRKETLSASAAGPAIERATAFVVPALLSAVQIF
ncbi:MAG: hypothetical protein ABI619_07410 [Betaproteobacteria bacterium]